MPIVVNRANIINGTMSYLKSPDVQARIKQEIMQRRKDGRGGKDIGMDIITEADMMNAASILKRLLYSTAAASGVPGSVVAHLADLAISGISYSNDFTEAMISLSYAGDISRPSIVRSDGSSGGGIDNIVELFDQGYHASSRVFGRYAAWDAMTGAGSDMTLISKPDREGLYFLQSALEEFNSTYGPTYHCVAVM